MIPINKDKFGNCYGPQVVTPLGRIMYPQLATPNQFKKYTANLLIEKTEKNKVDVEKDLLELANACLVEMYGSEANIPDSLPSMPVVDGDEADEEGKLNETTKGYWILRLSSKQALTSATCVDANTQPYDPANLVGGMWVRAVVNPMAFKYSSVSFGVVWQLAQLQFVKDDGVRLRGSVPQGTLLTPIAVDDAPTVGMGALASAAAAPTKKSGLRALA